MPDPRPPSKPTSAPTISAFTTLRGGSPMELVPGDTQDAPIVALHPSRATWWNTNAATDVALTGATLVGGARWLTPDKLRVGLGTLDLTARSYVLDPSFTAFTGVQAIAWFPGGERAALLLGPPRPRTDRPPPRDYDPSRRELVIAGGTTAPVRRSITIEGTATIAAGGDRVLVAANTSLLFDAAANVVAGPDALPRYVSRASFGDKHFVVVGGDGTVALLDSHVVATWSLQGTSDAVAIPGGVIAVDLKGIVRVGCLVGRAVKQVAETSAGTIATCVQLVGNRLVVAADGADPLRVATFTNPCR